VKIVASLTTTEEMKEAASFGADLIELRLDCMAPDEDILPAMRATPLPVILTLRSHQEGGAFTGDAISWSETVRPLIGAATWVDIERPYSQYAQTLRQFGPKVIASAHLYEMPGPAALSQLFDSLRKYGDLSKIVVTPTSIEDIFSLIDFTLHAQSPVCTGVMGERFRYARAILPFFGSSFVYCHTGKPTAAGQYHVAEMVEIREKLS
jgi:3-dehydroquinate dehydratase-1